MLTALLVEGHAMETAMRTPPRGLQLLLHAASSGDGDEEDDTMVMANFGYFQLRAPRPGRWSIVLRDGISRTACGFGAVQTDDAMSAVHVSSDAVKLTFDLVSLQGITLYPQIQLRSHAYSLDDLLKQDATEAAKTKQPIWQK